MEYYFDNVNTLIVDEIRNNIGTLPLHVKKIIYKDLMKDCVGISHPKHFSFSRNLWTLITWQKDEVPFLKNNKHLLTNIDKLISEMLNTDRKTTVKPDQIQLLNGSPTNTKIIKYQNNIENILTNLGMSEMAKRSTGATASHNTHHAVGTGLTAETLNDATLETEVGRKEIGSALVSNQTERYGSSFSYEDVGSENRDITEAGILTAAVNGILILRITSDPQPLTEDRLITVQTNVSHQNGIEI